MFIRYIVIYSAVTSAYIIYMNYIGKTCVSFGKLRYQISTGFKTFRFVMDRLRIIKHRGIKNLSLYEVLEDVASE